MSTLPPSTAEMANAVMVPEVMAALRLSRSKVYDLIRSKELRSFTVGRCRRIPSSEITRFMQHRLEADS